MIPKIIWQTHNYIIEDLPDHIRKCMKTWINLNPEWEHRYVNHIEREEFVRLKSKRLHDIYMVSNPVAQSDIWRLLCLYEFGGVYADMDSMCIKPLDYMLEKYSGQQFVSVKKYDSGQINIANFAVPEKSPIMLEIINYATNGPVESLDWHAWIAFNKYICKLGEDHQFFDADSHSKDYKERFVELEVDYYGSKMSYREYLQNIAKLNKNDYEDSILN